MLSTKNPLFRTTYLSIVTADNDCGNLYNIGECKIEKNVPVSQILMGQLLRRCVRIKCQHPIQMFEAVAHILTDENSKILMLRDTPAVANSSSSRSNSILQ